MTDSTKRVLRTVLQMIVGLAVALPMIVHASGIPETAPGVGVGLAVSAAVTRIMAIPAVQAVLPNWLRTDEGSGT
ncbi:hypothetical protein [Streptomyces sp. MUM 16J]|uniref:hypothetical protein n=1 Tax=Streptomyces sp. MUM 16J TaxID=2791988 RepID=UPI001F0463A0|nr:hypothetical protein [Streptomyces sp. MUM 16J]MCH0555824.1 hypothetical protein [Streptomyces sp. MUM 16J]